MDVRGWHGRVIAGQAGFGAECARAVLGRLARMYGLGVAVRNRWLDRRGGATGPPVPVISVGNITVGGTGKTPVVIDIARRLVERGRRPGIISRGYGAGADGLNDEHRLIARRCPDAACVCDPDRARGAELAVHRDGADVILLDDGFQHRRVRRDLDIVLIDATRPFGFDHLLPRGLLREPLAGLRRADLIIITRSDQVDARERARIAQRVRSCNASAPLIECTHRVESVGWLDQGSAADRAEPPRLRGTSVLCCAAIGNPPAFEATVASLGARIVGRRWFADHHRYHPHDFEALLRAHPPGTFDALVVTEKDAVKLEGMLLPAGLRVAVVRVTIDFPHGGDTILSGLLDDLPGSD